MNPSRAMATAAPSSAAALLRRSWSTHAFAAAGAGGADDAPRSQRRRVSSSFVPGRRTLSWRQDDDRQRQPSHHFYHPSVYHRQQTRRFARKTHRFKKRHFPRSDSGDGYSLTDLDDPARDRDDKTVLVIGSSGVLGKTLVSHFGHGRDWNVIGADVLDPSEAANNKGLGDYIQLPRDGSVAELTGELYRGVRRRLGGGGRKSDEDRLDAIVCASGGGAGDVDLAEMVKGHLADSDRSELEDVDIEEKYARESAEVCERMMRVNYFPIVAGSQVGRRFMKRGGLFCIIGASAALSPTPSMVGYGAAKSAAHHYLQSWGPLVMDQNDVHAVGILPLMIDTPANRDMFSDAGEDERYSKMVKPAHIAREIGEWLRLPCLMPHAGSLVKVIAKGGGRGAAFHLAR